MKCMHDKNNIHIFFCSRNNVHKYDSFFSYGRIHLHHLKSEAIQRIDMVNECYHRLILNSGFEFHWIVQLTPDVIIFDPNIFVNMRTKYNNKSIHARVANYTGPLQLTRQQKSSKDETNYNYANKETLKLFDTHIFLIPQFWQYYAFLPYDITKIRALKTDSLKQTNIWKDKSIPVQITELYVY